MSPGQNELFARMWERGAAETTLMRRFDLTRGQVRKVRKGLGLEARDPRFAKPKKTETPEAVVTKCPDMPEHPFWSPARDALVFRTKGKYAAVEDVATVLGKSPAFVMQRWHQLRVSA